jgi:hypothetical protein
VITLFGESIDDAHEASCLEKLAMRHSLGSINTLQPVFSMIGTGVVALELK